MVAGCRYEREDDELCFASVEIEVSVEHLNRDVQLAAHRVLIIDSEIETRDLDLKVLNTHGVTQDMKVDKVIQRIYVEHDLGAELDLRDTLASKGLLKEM